MAIHHSSATADYALEGLGPCLRLVDSEALLPVLQATFSGWPLTPCVSQSTVPGVCVWRCAEGYWQEAPALPEGMLLDTSVGTACSVIADMAGAFLARHPEFVGVHCGAVEIDGRLVIFPESHRAGKSTLTAAFAAAGYRVFGDDVLALTAEGEGISLGVAPRLRLPLPEALADDFHDFVASHLGPQDERYGYLALNDQQMARHGDACPLGAVVLIDRDDQLATPQLTSLQPGEGLWQLLKQNFAEHTSSQMLIERFLPLLMRVPCVLLRYRDAYQAAVFLGQHWPSVSAKESVGNPLLKEIGVLEEAPSLLHEQSYWQAAPAVLEYPLGNELFVIAADGGVIHRLNSTGRAVWALLQHEPLSVDDVAEALAAFFADTQLAQVKTDVASLMGQLHIQGLIVDADKGVTSG